MSEQQGAAELARAVLGEIGGLYPAVADGAPVTRLPRVADPWISEPGPGFCVRVLITADALPARPRLVAVRERLMELLDVDVEVLLVDVIAEAPDGLDVVDAAVR
jgi:hypothetical protein